MTVAAVMMVKDEVDIVGRTVDHLLGQVDFVIVADNGSTDGTRDVLADLTASLRVSVIDDQEPAYYQSEKMTALAHRAHTAGADWVVPCDADEIWYSPFGRIADVLDAVAPQWLAAAAELYDHVPSAVDPLVEDPVQRIVHRRRAPAALPKVACRWRDDLVIEQGNHAARYVGGSTVLAGQLVIRHYPYRSAEQFVRKARNGAAAYAATDLPPSVGAHWRQYGAIADAHGDEACADIFRKWFWSSDPDADDLICDPAPIEP